MAQLNDLIVSGSAKFVGTIYGTVDKAISDQNGSNIASTYMKKGVDYVTAGQKSGTTLGSEATAEGYQTTSSMDACHAEGNTTVASSVYAHAEGNKSTASGQRSHAEGYQTTASATAAHSEGYYTQATVGWSHAEGYYTQANGYYSHAEGYYSRANGTGSFACGRYSIAAEDYQFVCGKYNADNSNAVFIIGDGTSSRTSDRHNALTITKKGMVTCGYVGGAVPSTRAAVANNTVPNLINELRYLNGAMGSVSISTAYTASSVTLPTGWYNYLWIPHRQGGVDGAQPSGGDNCNYGCLLMLGMTVGPSMFWIRYSNGSVAYMKKLAGS